MGDIEVASRIIAAGTNAQYGDITRRDVGKLDSSGSLKRIETWLQEQAGIPLFVCDRESLTLRQIAADARAMKQQCGLDFIAVDYLQLLQGEKVSASEQETLSKLSRGMKMLSRELNVAVICAAQLNREAAKGERPKPSDLRGSGSLEQDSDVVVLMHHAGTEQEPTGDVEMILGKNRTGPKMTVNLFWRPHQAKIGRWGEFDPAQQVQTESGSDWSPTDVVWRENV
jgi:replicative DNA helicase